MNRVLCSFSGGRTSALMSMLIKHHWRDREVLYIFANTGQEDERTLRFVQQVDEHFSLGVVWVEAVVHPEDGVGTSFRVVTFDTATRDWSLFAAMSAKFGIPNMAYPHCTRELKQRPITSYLRSIGWESGSYVTALGYRIDEPARAKNKPTDQVFPLITVWPMDKQDVNTFWENQPFNLELKEYQGNCRWCWKKHEPKLVRLVKEDRSIFDVPARLEREFGSIKAPNGPRTLFRKHRSTIDILNLADVWPDQLPLLDEDGSGGCSESCEFTTAIED